MRLFVAVPLGAEVRARVEAVQRGLRRRCDKAGLRASYPALETMHLTLKFLGEVTEERSGAVGDALAALGREPAFHVELARLGAFPPHGRPRVLWLGVGAGADDLVRLAGATESCLETLGFSRESRPFHPHVTLARVKRASGRHTSVLDDLGPHEGIPVEVTEVVLFESVLSPTRVLHRPLVRVGLGRTETDPDIAQKIAKNDQTS